MRRVSPGSVPPNRKHSFMHTDLPLADQRHLSGSKIVSRVKGCRNLAPDGIQSNRNHTVI